MSMKNSSDTIGNRKLCLMVQCLNQLSLHLPHSIDGGRHFIFAL